MIKETPSLGRILAMVIFSLSCIGLLLFLWLAFGGSIPLKPQGYRFKVDIPEAATLAQEADVRMAGVNVGKVKTKTLDKRGARTTVTIEMDRKFAPIPKDSRVMLRQKTLLGETYVEITPGRKSAGNLKDGGLLPNTHVQPTVELDEIFSSFDKPTRTAFQQWMSELAKTIDKGRGQDLNDAFGNLSGFAADGSKLLQVLDEQNVAVRRLFRNTGEVFQALNQREGALHDLIVNSNNTFEATDRAREALAQAIQIFPTFLDESRVTMNRLEGFSRNADPLVRQLQGPADDLGPTVRDLGRLAPDLERLFRNLDTLRVRSRTSLPQLSQVLEKLQPVLTELHPFFTQLNPILSEFNFYQETIACFISCGGANLAGKSGANCVPFQWTPTCRRHQTNFGITEARSFQKFYTRQDWERGNAYIAPNAYLRALALGTVESFDCTAAGGEKVNPNDAVNTPEPLKNGQKRPPCFVAPPSLYDNQRFPYPKAGQAPNRRKPTGLQGNRPARDPNPGDPKY